MTPHAPLGRRAGATLAAVAAFALLAAGCTSSTKGEVNNGSPVAGSNSGAGSSAATGSSAPTTSASAVSATIHVPLKSIDAFNPAQPVTVAVDHGTLTSVKLVNPDGLVVTGAYNADKTTWTSTEDLGYSKTYQLSAEAVDTNGGAVHRAEAITTVAPSNLTMPYLDDIYGSSLIAGGTYGVGMIPVVHFDEPIPDKAAAERALQVTATTPGGHSISGVWAWLDDQNVHWRSENYLPAGSHITVTAKVYGVQVGPGLFGQADKSVSYKIGAKHVSVADDATHQVSVYFSDKLVRTMPTSMGQGGFVTGDHGQQIPLWTMPGTYTVLGFENPAIMSSDSYGLPANSPKGYAPEKVYWSTKISTDGIYLHELDATVWAQGSRDLSHGCLNLNLDNAKWFFQHAQIGDIVQVKNTHAVDGQQSAPVAWWQGGDWSVPWSTWLHNSALPH